MASARVRGRQHVLAGSLRPLNGIDECDLLARENLGDGLSKLIPAGLAARKHGANKYRIAELEVLGFRLANKVEITHNQARFGTERDSGKRIGQRGDERLHGRRDREHGVEGRRQQRALGSATPLVGAPANNRTGCGIANSDNQIVAGDAVGRQGAKDSIEELAFDLEPAAYIEEFRRQQFVRSNRSMLPLPAALGAIRLTSVEDEVLERHAHAYLASRKELL